MARLTNAADIAAGNIEKATEPMNEQGGGWVKHCTECGGKESAGQD